MYIENEKINRAEYEHRLIPIEGCFVELSAKPGNLAVVEKQLSNSRIKVKCESGELILSFGEWTNGIQIGFIVQDVPLSAARKTSGLGTVISLRSIAGREQVAVQNHKTGTINWFPFERLIRVMDPILHYIRSENTSDDAGTKTALHFMARALDYWNETTGAFTRLDIDPLPHQISLVHQILASGTANWIIADDVGLGKTIEVGLLLGALERQRKLRRVLIIVPASLTRQWKDEMQMKFDRDFVIFGEDIHPKHPREWKLYDKVIASMDRIKPLNDSDNIDSEVITNFSSILSSDNWDLIIFDEAHRLSRDEKGRQTLRFRLAQALREQCDEMLLLTGTPHQGDSGKFQNLLRLARPDLSDAINNISNNPEVVGEIIVRNRKEDTVDLEGDFLFKGISVSIVEIPQSREMRELDVRLRAYLNKGYSIGNDLGGPQGRAIGFVMTIYRKLASSSVFALAVSMGKRKARLQEEKKQESHLVAEDDEFHEVVNDQLERDIDNVASSPFFDNEVVLIDSIIEQAKICLRHDTKFSELKNLVSELVREKGESLLIFTEYRQTQKYLSVGLKPIIGEIPLMIHGGMSAAEKRATVIAFEEKGKVLVSTEAGGEGLNLQRNCHVMVNYDLPWNPARLTQRIGRLYRYGQAKQVVVVNFQTSDSIDNRILSGIFSRLNTIVAQMSNVSGEFHPRYYAEVLGELLERLDISELLTTSRENNLERSQDRIDEAISNACKAKELQDDIFVGIKKPDGIGIQGQGVYSTEDLAIFIKIACIYLDIEIEEKHSVERFSMRLPPDLVGRFSEFGRRSVVEATTKRGWRGKENSEIVLLDFSNEFVRYAIDYASSPEFGGFFGGIKFYNSEDEKISLIAGFDILMQTDQGENRGRNLAIIKQFSDGSFTLDNGILHKLFDIAKGKSGFDNLLKPSEEDIKILGDRQNVSSALIDRAEICAAEMCTRYIHPNSINCAAILETYTHQKN